MSDLYDILDICLQEIEQGTDLETILSRYPKYADELRPMLETSVRAIQLAPPGPAPEVERRGRAKVLQHAALMREMRARPSRRLWSVTLRRALVTLAVVGALFISSTRLVEASTTTLPGDNLYPVKRTWEDIHVLFTFDNQAREALEVEQENERLNELNGLFTKGRSAQVDFTGIVMSQNGALWEVSKVPVLLSAQTQPVTQPVVVGDAVRVTGNTQSGGTVLAQRIDRLPAGIPLPKIDDDQLPAAGQQKTDGEQQQPNSGENGSGEDSEDGSSKQGPIQTPQAESQSRDFSLKGVVNSLNGNTVVVNGQSMNISGININGTLIAGSNVKVEGYFDANGVFVVTKIEVESSSSGNESTVNDNGSKDSGGNNSGSDSNENNHEDNNNTSGGGGDN